MRPTKYMEKILMDEVETLKRKGGLATEAVNEFVQSVEKKVLQRTTYNVQDHFTELQTILRNSCVALDRLIMGLADMAPSPEGNPALGDFSRPMIASNTTPSTEWSIRDCTVRNGTEQAMSLSSPDIQTEPLVEESSSSSSITSCTRPTHKDVYSNLLKQQPRRSALEDEFAMEIPAPPTVLNVDAPEFRPQPGTLSGNSIKSQTSTLKPGDTLTQEKVVHPTTSGNSSFSDAPMETKSLSSRAPTILTTSSSVEDYSTPSANDSSSKYNNHNGDMKGPKSSASSVSLQRSPIAIEDRNGLEKPISNGYPAEAETQPSSLSKTTMYDTDQILRDTVQVLREKKGLLREEQTSNRLVDWNSKLTVGEVPKDVRRTRVPPLWSYLFVSLTDVNLETGKIHVQLHADENTIHKLTDEFAKPAHLSGSTQLKMEDITEGLIVTAPFENIRYRAKVISKNSETDIDVLFIDFGNSNKVELKDLTPISSRTGLKTCKMAIPCVLDEALVWPDLLKQLPDSANVCLGNPMEINGETVYKIMDIMGSDRENFLDVPEAIPFKASDAPGSANNYDVIVTHALNPRMMWVAEYKDKDVAKQIENILRELPPEPCLPDLAGRKCTYLAYDEHRAMVTDYQDGNFELLLIDTGKNVKNIPISACRRLPLMAHRMPPVARTVCLANCKVSPDRPGIEEEFAGIIGKRFDMRVKNDESEEVILIDPDTRKYLASSFK